MKYFGVILIAFIFFFLASTCSEAESLYVVEQIDNSYYR